jgi:glycosyltransferase involved in cell wall biosynthesis
VDVLAVQGARRNKNSALNWMPFFSIIIPTFNRRDHLPITIASILAQKLSDFELIIVDDGSTDGTEDVVGKFTDPRVKFFRKQNGERGAARNFGAQRASGKYVNFFDSDDLMYDNHLSEARRFIDNNNGPEIFHMAYDYKSEDGRLIYTRNNFGAESMSTLLFDNVLSCNGVLIRTDVVRAMPFEENRVLASAEDWALWIRMASRYKIHFSNTVTSAIIGHDLRSIHTINMDKLVTRDKFLIGHLRADQKVQELYDGRFSKFVAERYTFFMLRFAELGNRKEVLRWASEAAGTYFPIIFSRRFVSSLFKLISR